MEAMPQWGFLAKLDLARFQAEGLALEGAGVWVGSIDSAWIFEGVGSTNNFVDGTSATADNSI